MPFNDDVIEIVTPERVNLDFPIAAIGSRFVAAAFDLAMVTALYFLVDFAFLPLNLGALADSDYLASITKAVQIAIQFLVTFGYYIWFEYAWNGRTPGKKLMKLRVIRYGGLPVDLSAVMIRNLMRVVDVILFAMAVGFLILFLSKLTQRPGDFAAGTVVVRDRQVSLRDLEHYLHAPVQETNGNQDVDRRFGKLGVEDINLLTQFMAREERMTDERKHEIRKKIADRIRQKLNIKLDEYPSDENLIKTAIESTERLKDKW